MLKWFMITAGLIGAFIWWLTGFWFLGLAFFLLVVFRGADKVILYQLIAGLVEYHNDRADYRMRERELHRSIENAYREKERLSRIYVDKAVFVDQKPGKVK